MSQSQLYRLFGIHGYSVNKIEVEDQVLYLYVEPQPHRICCSHCKSKNVIRRGSSERIAAVVADWQQGDVCGGNDPSG